MVRTRVWDRWHDDASCPGQGSKHRAALISFLFLTLISFLFLTLIPFLFLTKVVVFFHTITILRQKGYTTAKAILAKAILRQRLYYGKGYTTAKAILRQRLYKASLPCVVTWVSTSICMQPQYYTTTSLGLVIQPIS